MNSNWYKHDNVVVYKNEYPYIPCDMIRKQLEKRVGPDSYHYIEFKFHHDIAVHFINCVNGPKGEWLSPYIDIYNWLKSFGRSYTFDMLQSLTELKLNDLKLSSLPNSIVCLQNLRKLDLSNNDFVEIPPVVCKLNNLEKLKMSYNKIKQIPSLKSLLHLKSLILENNRIEEIPATIAELTNLNNLDLDFNLIKEIPKELCTLPFLGHLYLRNNFIKEVPDEVCNLKELEYCELVMNRITYISEKVSNLSMGKIQVISVDDNVEILPTESNSIPTAKEAKEMTAHVQEKLWKYAQPIVAKEIKEAIDNSCYGVELTIESKYWDIIEEKLRPLGYVIDVDHNHCKISWN